MTREDIAEALKTLSDKVKNGCSNHGCVINKAPGMKTNSTCRCKPYWVIKDLESLIQEIKDSGISWKE